MKNKFTNLTRILNYFLAPLREANIIVILFYCFFILVLLVDKDIPNKILDISIYINLLFGIILIPPSTIRRILTSKILVICFVFIAHYLLSPIWTGGGMPTDRWLETARLGALGFGGALLVGSMVSMPWKMLRWFPLLAACAAILISVFSIWRFLVNASSHWGDTRLVTLPWPNPNTGTAVLGLLIAGLAFIPVVRIIPASASQPSAQGFRSPQTGTHRFWCNALMLCTVSLPLLDIFLASTRSVLVALSIVIIFFILYPTPHKYPKWRLFFLAGVAIIIFGAIFWSFISGNQLIMFRGPGQRDELLIGFWHLASETFWLGRGIQNEYQLSVSGITAPHNQFLTALLYGGIGSAVLYCALYARMLFVGIKYYARLGCFSLAAITTYVIVHGMFETVVIASYPGWRWLYFWAPIGLAAGLEVRLRSVT